MLRGMLVVNAFLHSAKFDELYQILLASAQQTGVTLTMRTNASLCAIVDGNAFDPDAFDFVLF